MCPLAYRSTLDNRNMSQTKFIIFPGLNPVSLSMNDTTTLLSSQQKSNQRAWLLPLLHPVWDRDHLSPMLKLSPKEEPGLVHLYFPRTCCTGKTGAQIFEWLFIFYAFLSSPFPMLLNVRCDHYTKTILSSLFSWHNLLFIFWIIVFLFLSSLFF